MARVERAAEEATERLRETSIALLEANQALARIPLLEHSLGETQVEFERLRDENARLTDESARLRDENVRLSEYGASAGARLRAIERSRSWRYLAPLRRLRSTLRR